LTLYLGQLAAANIVVLLLVTAAISIVLGMGMPTVAVYVLLAALIAPAMVKAGLDPMASHMFLLYFGMLSMRRRWPSRASPPPASPRRISGVPAGRA
jgi:TRAP-type uncharacterized transport system fused permease subunit